MGSFPLRWRHNGRDGVSNHQPHDCLLNGLFRRRSKKMSQLRVTGLCAGNSPGTGEFPAEMASNVENVSIWLRHHGILYHCIPEVVRFVWKIPYRFEILPALWQKHYREACEIWEQSSNSMNKFRCFEISRDLTMKRLVWYLNGTQVKAGPPTANTMTWTCFRINGALWGVPSITGGFSSEKKCVTWSFDVAVSMIRLMNKQYNWRWVEALWRSYDITVMKPAYSAMQNWSISVDIFLLGTFLDWSRCISLCSYWKL